MTLTWISALRRLLHYGFHLLVGAVIVVCLAALGFKFWVMPDVMRFKPDVEAAASRALGQPVTLEALQADWSGLNPRLTLVNLAIPGESGARLPRVEAVLSWLSLALLEPRLASLTLEQPELALRRDKSGVIYAAGMPINTATAPSPFPDWLLQQPLIIVRNARVTWLDEWLNAPLLRFDQIRLLIVNRFDRHRFAAVALPSDAAGRLELRGDLHGESTRRIKDWSGELYARVDAARFDTWGRWAPWAQQAVHGGAGNLRFWARLEQGGFASLRGDARFNGVAVRIQEGLPDLTFQHLSGRVGWERQSNRAGVVLSHSFFVDKLRFAVAGETPSEPAALRITLQPDGQGGFARVAARASNLRLEALTALTSALPLPRKGHDLIQALHPRGLVENAEGHWAGARDYSFKLRLHQAGLNAHGALPGFSGVSARIEADSQQGLAEIQGRDLVLSLDRVFRQPLVFQTLNAHAHWKTQDSVQRITLEEVELHNADLDATAQGWIELPREGAPRVDIQAHLTRGEATAVHRYLPRVVGDNAHAWLQRGLQGGHSEDTRLVLKGDLSRFPFDRGGGEFKVSVAMQDGILDYGEGWPRIEGVQGMLVFQGISMDIQANDGRILGARLGPVNVRIPDLHGSYQEELLVDGRARGPTREFLEYVRQSPVARHTGGFTETLSAEGDAELTLHLQLPLRHLEDSHVNGVLRVQNNRISLGGELPDLEAVEGAITFSEEAVQARDVRLQVLKLPASLSFESEKGGRVQALLQGLASAADLKPHLPAVLASRLSGSTSWRADVALSDRAGMSAPDGASRQHQEIEVNSDLKGLALNLPAPFGKSAADAIPLVLRRTPEDAGGSRIAARYGDLLALRALAPKTGPARLAVRLSAGDAPEPAEPGLVLSGSLDKLDLDAWRGLMAESGEGLKQEGGLRIPEIQLSLGELKAGGYLWHDTRIRARPAGQGWNLSLAGREATGDVLVLNEARGTQVIANLKRLAVPEALPGAQTESPGDSLPASLEANIQSFAWKGREMGELHLRLSPEPGVYRIDHFSLAAQEARLEARGTLSRQARRATQLALKLESADLGRLLGRVGYRGAVRGGKANVQGRLGWMGGIETFRLAALEGGFQVDLGQGQFLKVEPGVAKLLGILNLQALPRRIALDFRDVFSDGFAFDEIKGDVHIQRGVAYAKDLKMNGPAAKVVMSGAVDLGAETQNLRIGIQPRLDDTVAVAGAILGGPVVGLGTVIANKLLRDPLGQAIGFEYDVTGTWSDPVVRKLKRAVAEPQ